MEHKVGETAGRVYEYLVRNSHSAVPLDDVRKAVGGQTVVFHMALGWLAREEKVTFSTLGRATMIELVKP